MVNLEGIVDVDGLELYVVRRGSGPPLLVIHGGPGWDHTYLRAFMTSLESSVELIFFDLRGCGRSQRFPNRNSLHIDHAVEDLRKLMAALKLNSTSILGFSFGGRIGLEFISRYPDSLQKFVLASSSAYPSEVRNVANPGFTAGNVTAVRDAALQSVEQDVAREKARQVARDVISEIRFSTGWPHPAESGRPISYPERDYSKTLNRHAIPTLILHGEHDLRFPVKLAERLASEVPTSRLEVIRHAGHLAHIDSPSEWNESVRKFIAAS